MSDELTARVQILRHFANLLYIDTEVPCDIHRQTIIPIESNERLDVSIGDEGTRGDDGSDELQTTMDNLARVSRIVVTVDVKGTGAFLRAEQLAGEVERAMTGGDGYGDHTVNGAAVTVAYTGAVGDPQYDDTQQTDYAVELLFTCSYRTPHGDPFTLS